MTRFCAIPTVLALLLAGVLPGVASAQDQKPTIPALEEGAAAPDLEAAPVEPADPEIDAIIERLTGSYRGERHTLHIVEVTSPPFDRPLYVELIRDGFETRPDRQQLWSIYRMDGELRVRVNVFPERQHSLFATSLPDLAVGMWAAPQFFPRLPTDMYDALGDLVVTQTEEALTLRSAERFPIHFGGAMFTEVLIEIGDESAAWLEAGRDASGEVVWGDETLAMERLEQTPKAIELESGVRIIELRPGRGAPVQEGHKIALHYEAWLTNGMLIDSTRIEGKQIMVADFPLGAMPGMNVGLRGMQAPVAPKQAPLFSGGIRRVLVPPAMALGDRGAPPIIPPGSPVIFNLELQSVNPDPLGNTAQPIEPGPNQGPGGQ